MITRKTLSLNNIFTFAGHHLYWLTAWMLIVTAIYYFTDWKVLTMPTLPLTLIGTSVAFYVGFKNNQSYDRLWEARKIWGAIINNSRIAGTTIKNLHSENTQPADSLDIRKQFIFRHIAYLYQLRVQLLQPTQWEHVSLGLRFGIFNQKRKNAIFRAYTKELEEIAHKKYLSEAEMQSLSKFSNKATHILDKQTEIVQLLFKNRQINMMQQMELQNTINNFYHEQGKAERIKKFPLPRQYSSFSFIFVCIFVFLLPFGLIGPISSLGKEMVWMTIPAGVIVGWVYVVMEIIGDYSENPFEGLFNDIPMLNICRTIEIDLLQMIGEEEIPLPVEPKNNILI
ncbi:bestrophin family protein [Gynurincola endophyticus]|uniref:bestrophin family protein n=1 Tax=Gynurincola endophyticus TaxID=2479004 RepID=UPI000F8E3C72|nr:bestrophin family ion channel [Gynurincola endophyticus]